MKHYNFLNIYRQYSHKYMKYRINKILSGDLVTSWKKIKKIFQRSRTVVRGPSGYFGDTNLAFEILLEFIRKYGNQSESLLTGELLNENPYIVGYCLVGLSMLNSSALHNLPKTLFNRQESVNWSLACIQQTTSLAYFAKLHELKTIEHSSAKFDITQRSVEKQKQLSLDLEKLLTEKKLL